MARTSHLPFAPPVIGDREIAAVVATLKSQWLTSGPQVREFQQRFAGLVGAKGALATNSCTAALHVALAGSGVGPGDEVITTPLTFVATANVIEHVGARPVFADVQDDTLNICPQAIERAITSKTKAVIVVHYAGHPVDLGPIRELTDAHGITLIEDAAHALPAWYKGAMIGSSPNPTAFSFYATKNLTTGDGGMLTGAEEWIEGVQPLILHGLSKDAWKRYDKGGKWAYEVVTPGFKYNLTDIQAAIGLVQLERLGSFHSHRQRVAGIYQKAFAGLEAIKTPTVRPDVTSAWHLYPIRVDEAQLTISRDAFVDALSERSIGTSVHFIPVHRHRFYAEKYKLSPGDLPIANGAFEQLISLPLGCHMSDEDAADVTQAVTEIVRKHRR